MKTSERLIQATLWWIIAGASSAISVGILFKHGATDMFTIQAGASIVAVLVALVKTNHTLVDVRDMEDLLRIAKFPLKKDGKNEDG